MTRKHMPMRAEMATLPTYGATRHGAFDSDPGPYPSLRLRWRSFTVAVSIGMSATVAGYLIGQSERFGHFYPWSMPAQVLGGQGQWTVFVAVAGVVGGAAVTAVGLWEFLHREPG